MEPPRPEDLLHVVDRAAWRAWLEENYRTAKQVWLVYYKKHTGKPRVSYNDAVEEALCFGWIDSTARALDADRYAQRFTPRRKGSAYSQTNLERLRSLVAQGRVMPEVLESLPDLSVENFTIAPDILAAIEQSETAWENFQGFSPAYIRIRIGFIEGARDRPAEFQKRLGHFIRMTERGRQYGFGGIEQHF